MRLAEVDGKALLRRHGLAVPRGVLFTAEPPIDTQHWGACMLKAQLLEGGRGKRGLVRRVESMDQLVPARQAITSVLGDGEAALLLEEVVASARELYVAIRIDGSRPGLELLVAPEGGQEVEQSSNLLRMPADDATRADVYSALLPLFARDLAARLARYCARLLEIMRQEDLELIEINPLVVTPDKRFIACDAKIIRDESADFRHDPGEFALSRMLSELALTPLERRARALGFQLVELEGDVALVTSGAGLGMMVMDLLADHGLRAACFMDNLRGAPDETMAQRLEIARELALRPAIRAIVFHTVLASRSLAERVDALLNWIGAGSLPKPLFVGMAAGHAATRTMSVDEAVAKLAAVGVPAFSDPLSLVRAAAAELSSGS
ncbi:MAG: ATP-grasp domain-containing protein [Xanthobacteraceae bacterium]